MVKTPGSQMQETWVQSLVGVLRSCIPCDVANNNNNIISCKETIGV